MHEDWLPEFIEECQRCLRMNVDDRIRFGFTYEYKPILDDAPSRSFNSMAEYRRWCDENLPKRLGYGSLEEIDREELDKQTALMVSRELDRRRKLRLRDNLP